MFLTIQELFREKFAFLLDASIYDKSFIRNKVRSRENLSNKIVV